MVMENIKSLEKMEKPTKHRGRDAHAAPFV